MPILHKSNTKFSESDSVTVNGKNYSPDYIIDLPLKDDDVISLKDYVCVFSIKIPENRFFRKYIGAVSMKDVDNTIISQKVNGYLPNSAFCFKSNTFPLEDFIKEQGFKKI
jgi:hypothetical protein